MKLSSSRVLQVGCCQEIFPLPDGDGEIVHIHVVGPAPLRAALVPTPTAESFAEQTVLQRSTAQFRLDKNKFVILRAMPEHDPSAHTKVVLSIGTDIITAA